MYFSAKPLWGLRYYGVIFFCGIITYFIALLLTRLLGVAPVFMPYVDGGVIIPVTHQFEMEKAMELAQELSSRGENVTLVAPRGQPLGTTTAKMAVITTDQWQWLLASKQRAIMNEKGVAANKRLDVAEVTTRFGNKLVVINNPRLTTTALEEYLKNP